MMFSGIYPEADEALNVLRRRILQGHEHSLWINRWFRNSTPGKGLGQRLSQVARSGLQP